MADRTIPAEEASELRILAELPAELDDLMDRALRAEQLIGFIADLAFATGESVEAIMESFGYSIEALATVLGLTVEELMARILASLPPGMNIVDSTALRNPGPKPILGRPVPSGFDPFASSNSGVSSQRLDRLERLFVRIANAVESHPHQQSNIRNGIR